MRVEPDRRIRRAALADDVAAEPDADTDPHADPGTDAHDARIAETHTQALADKAVRRLTAGLAAGAFSVAALSSKTGARYSYGATGGMRTGSVIKVCILEALLLQHQDAHTRVTYSEDKTATALIEHSDNAATEIMYTAIGGRDGLVQAIRRLGLKHTVTGPLLNYWGLTVTSAPDYLAVLGNLVLGQAARRLLTRVRAEPDAARGVRPAMGRRRRR